MKIENTRVEGFEASMRGMRNPKDSWNKSDSSDIQGIFVLGNKDKFLSQCLVKAGNDHGKHIRMIVVWAQI
jgi:hypothetical protein